MSAVEQRYRTGNAVSFILYHARWSTLPQLTSSSQCNPPSASRLVISAPLVTSHRRIVLS
jgi:hypothetical protein